MQGHARAVHGRGPARTCSSAARASSSSWSPRCSTRPARSRSRSPPRCKGAGGYGKTTLARAICHEEAIQNAFDDGILWVTLGEQPGDIQSRVVDLIEVLTNERPGFTTLDAAVTRLGEVIGERRMLIVIDDVWQAAHARPFLQAGPNCARLITTRNRDVLPPNAKPLDVDAMQASEAIKLLRFGLPDGEDATFAQACAAPRRMAAAPEARERRVAQTRWPPVSRLPPRSPG